MHFINKKVKDIIRLIESIEADAADNNYELDDCQEIVYNAVDKNFQRFESELKANDLALILAQGLALAAKGSYDGYFPESAVEDLVSLNFRPTKKLYSFLKNNGFANSKRKIASKARKAAHALQKIGDKYFPQEQLMSITNGDEEVVWTDCFPEFWRYLLSGLVPGENGERM